MFQPDLMFLRAKLYIPINSIDTDLVKKHYDHHRYEEEICRQCEFRPHRFSDECAACEKGGYLGNLRTWTTKTHKGETYVALPIGDRLKIERKLGIEFSQFKKVDLRNSAPMKHGIKFKKKFKLKPEQKTMVQDWLDYRHGVLKAPPRTGKTVTSLYTVIKLGQKTVIVANQRDYLKNFIEELEEWTNVKELIQRGNLSYGWLKNNEADYKNFDIGIITYQSLISDKNGKKRRAWINKYFGCVWVDECFTGDHCVMTDKGLLRLDEVTTGETGAQFVLSKNLDTGEQEYRQIESYTKKDVTDLCKIHTDEGVFTCTPTHLIWSKTRNTYVEAQNLTTEDELDLSV